MLLSSPNPIIIAHRGASGYRPEHTLSAYELAIDMGADYIEPDLVMTKDKVLVARHENEISGTTDVGAHPEFAKRRTRKQIDGVAVSGWFTEDFTLAELKTLRARERIPELRPANTRYDGQFTIPTLEEIIALVKHKETTLHRRIGLYPETKHPSYFRGIGLAEEEPLLAILHQHGYREADAPVFIQSFEVGNLQHLRGLTRLQLIQLIEAEGSPYDFVQSGDTRTYADLIKPTGLAGIARYAQGIGPDKRLIIASDPQGKLLAPSPLIKNAHAAGLQVHPWTLRSENLFLPLDYRRGRDSDPAYPALHGDAEKEYQLLFSLGVDGLFSDFSDTAIRARQQHLTTKPAS